MRTSEVFGVSNEQIASYVERKMVDEKFLDGLDRNKHIIIFGSSKQGKTALTNKHLESNQFIRVNCAPETTCLDIYKSILRQLKIEFENEYVQKAGTVSNAELSLKAKVKIPLLGSGEAGAKGSIESTNEKETKFKTIEYNLSLPQDVSEILKEISFNKRIIIENFHYLDEDVQKELAFHLRVFEDYNILFIILGIWREKNRLAQFNGDLQDRLIEIPVEPWLAEDFKMVISIGEEILNVSFTDIIEEIIENSFDSIGVFQELCKETCLAAGVNETMPQKISLNIEHLKTAKEKKLDDYYGRHVRSIETFIEQRAKSSNEVPLYIAYYFIKYLFSLDFNHIQTGLKRSAIHEGIKEMHHRPADVRPSDMSYFLHNIVSSQIKKRIIPPLFDYDRSTRKLKIIDSTLYFFLKNIDTTDFMDEFEIPVPETP